MNKYLILSDTHFGNHKKFANYSEDGFNSRFLLQLEAFDKLLYKAFNDHGVSRIFHCGDVFNFRGRVEPEVVNKVVSIMQEYCSQYYFLTGNHDITTEGAFFNSAMLLDDKIEGNTCVFSEPKDVQFEDTDVLFVPYTRKSIEQVVEEKLVAPIKNTVLFLHQSILGCMYNGEVMKEGVDLSYLRKFKAVFCGHIHTASDFGKNVHIVGAPWQMGFGDDNKKRALIVDEQFKVVEQLIPIHPKFITVQSLNEIKSTKDFHRLQTTEKLKDLPPNTVQQSTVQVQNHTRINSSAPSVVLKAYCKNQHAPEMLESGLGILEQAKKESEQ